VTHQAHQMVERVWQEGGGGGGGGGRDRNILGEAAWTRGRPLLGLSLSGGRTASALESRARTVRPGNDDHACCGGIGP